MASTLSNSLQNLHPKSYLFLGFGPIAARIISRIPRNENSVIHVISERTKNSSLPVNTRFWKTSDAVALIKTTNFDIVINSWRSLKSTDYSNRREILTNLATFHPQIYFINLSTVAVYGELSDYHKETSNVNPINSYGVEKLEIERLIALAGFSQVQNLRISNVFGDTGLNDVVNQIINAASNKIEISLTEPRIVFRDFIHIDIVVAYISELIKTRPLNNYETTNVASGDSLSLFEVFEICNQIFQGQLTYSIRNLKPHEIRVSRLNVEKFLSRFEVKSNSFSVQLLNYVNENEQ